MDPPLPPAPPCPIHPVISAVNLQWLHRHAACSNSLFLKNLWHRSNREWVRVDSLGNTPVNTGGPIKQERGFSDDRDFTNDLEAFTIDCLIPTHLHLLLLTGKKCGLAPLRARHCSSSDAVPGSLNCEVGIFTKVSKLLASLTAARNIS